MVICDMVESFSGDVRVLHIITSLFTGGAERVLTNVLAGGHSRFAQPAVVSLKDEGTMGAYLRNSGVLVTKIEMNGAISSPRVLLKLLSVVRGFRPDFIQGWMYHGNLAASVAARFAPGKPAVAWNIRHSLYDLKAEKPVTRQVIRANRILSKGADSIIYNSRLARAQHERLGFQERRGIVIPNGFDCDRLRPDVGTGMAVRHEVGFSAAEVVIGNVARFHPMKDHASFLRAAVRVAQENPSVRFLLVGREVSPDNPALAGIVPPELLERFVFTGERSDAHRLMQAMDVLIISSAWGEAFPNVLGEAMACGVPCVATDVGDSAYIVQDAGIVVPPSDTDALVGALDAMIRKGREERRALGRAARKRVQSHFSLDSVVAQYGDLYETLLAR